MMTKEELLSQIEEDYRDALQYAQERRDRRTQEALTHAIAFASLNAAGFAYAPESWWGFESPILEPQSAADWRAIHSVLGKLVHSGMYPVDDRPGSKSREVWVCLRPEKRELRNFAIRYRKKLPRKGPKKCTLKTVRSVCVQRAVVCE